MPIPADVVKVVLEGTLIGGEIWQTGFWMGVTAPQTPASLNALCAEVDGIVGKDTAPLGLFTNMAAAMWNSSTKYTDVRAYAYTGGLTAAFVGQFQRATPIVGGKAVSMPNQCAVVATLNTGLAGRRHRGRMYFPLTGALMASTGQLQATDTDIVASGLTAAFTALNAVAGRQVNVLSRVAGTVQRVTGITVDSKVDIQRRRANQQLPLARSLGTVS